MNANAAEPRAAEFDNLQDEGQPSGRDVNLDVILDVPVTLSMEVGRTRIPIRNLLQLNQGSVVELDRAAGEPELQQRGAEWPTQPARGSLLGGRGFQHEHGLDQLGGA